MIEQHGPQQVVLHNFSQITREMAGDNGAESPKRMGIVGAGPAGCLLALLVGDSSDIHVYDYRPDPRKEQSTRPRSINLALSTRGLTALRQAGVLDTVVKNAVPMHGRCIHAVGGQLSFHQYGQADQYLLSVSRTLLTNILIEACEQKDNVTLHFDSKCMQVDLKTVSLSLQAISGETEGHSSGESYVEKFDLIVGADGAFSKVRSAMAREDCFDYSQTFIPAAYKELSLTTHKFPAEWLHIWPRHEFMLIALPNFDGSFTCTLFMDKNHFDKLADEASIRRFFETNFTDAVRYMPSLVDDFCDNPTPSLLTIRCAPYNYKDKAVIIGDAAHAIVPFYGQGCNAAFEDCRLLAESISRHGWSGIGEAIREYSETRKEHADAIAELAIDHYEDMSSRTVRPMAVLRRKMEILVNRLFPTSFLPLYSMISFSNIPYADAVRRAERQDEIIDRYVKATLVMGTSSLVALGAWQLWRLKK